jgi:hypothetical protein
MAAPACAKITPLSKMENHRRNPRDNSGDGRHRDCHNVTMAADEKPVAAVDFVIH